MSHKSRTVYSTGGACFKSDCKNRNIKCQICAQIIGKYTKYEKEEQCDKKNTTSK